MKGIATDRVRNVALIGHSGAGKTTLVESLMLSGGLVSRAGRVEDGNTVSDYDPLEHQFHHSIWTSLVSLDWHDHRINLLDTPGYMDFEGEVISALAASDAALFCVDASSGVEAGTEAAWASSERLGVSARVFAITRLDREHADWNAAVESIRASFGARAVPVALPGGERGVIDLMHGAAMSADPDVATAREALIEALADADDALLERYLEGENVSDDELCAVLAQAVRTGDVFPILPAGAYTSTGLNELLDLAAAMLPSPESRAVVTATGDPVPADEDGPAIVHVFKTVADPFVGHISYVRVLSGRVEAGGHLQNPRARTDERIPHLYLARGREQVATPSLERGELGVIPKLQSTHTGDVLVGPGGVALELEPIPFPAALFRSAIHPQRQDDVDKLSTALGRLTEQDPTIHIERDAGTGELVLSTMGDVQASVAASRLGKTYGVQVDVAIPRVPYRETIRREVTAEHRHKKQTGGRGQYGHVVIKVEPLPRGSGFEFAERVVGGAVPRSFIPAAQQGVEEALAHGPITGAPLVDLRVTLIDGSSHSVDSSELAFKLAGSHALQEAAQQADPVMLEPVMRLAISAPSDRVGDITGEIAGKRGAIQGVDAHDDVTVIQAQAPLAEIQRFTTELRAITGGRGRFELAFDHYAEVPPQVQERLMEQTRAAS